MLLEITKTMPAETKFLTETWYNSKSKEEQTVIDDIVEGAYTLGKMKIMYDLKEEVLKRFSVADLKENAQKVLDQLEKMKDSDIVDPDDKRWETKTTEEGQTSSDQS